MRPKTEQERIDQIIHEYEECALAVRLWLHNNYSPEQAGLVYKWIGTPIWNDLTNPVPIDHPDKPDEF